MKDVEHMLTGWKLIVGANAVDTSAVEGYKGQHQLKRWLLSWLRHEEEFPDTSFTEPGHFCNLSLLVMTLVWVKMSNSRTISYYLSNPQVGVVQDMGTVSIPSHSGVFKLVSIFTISSGL